MFYIACAGLPTITVGKASRANARETLPRAAREGGHPTVADKLLRLLVEGLTDGEAESDHLIPADDGGAPSCSTAGFRPTSTPRGPEIVDLGRSQRP